MPIAEPQLAEFHVATLADVARFSRRTERCVQNWIKAGCPGKVDGVYSLQAISEWRIEAAAKSQAASAKPADDPLEIERLKKLRIENARNALRLRKLAGELVEREAAFAEIEQMFAVVAARFTAAPEEVAASLPPELQADVVSELKHRVDLILVELSEVRGPRDSPGLATSAAPAAADDEPATTATDAASDDES